MPIKQCRRVCRKILIPGQDGAPPWSGTSCRSVCDITVAPWGPTPAARPGSRWATVDLDGRPALVSPLGAGLAELLTLCPDPGQPELPRDVADRWLASAANPVESKPMCDNNNPLTALDVSGLLLLVCTAMLSPRTVASILARKRDRWVPEKGTAPSNVIANLPSGDTSDALTISLGLGDTDDLETDGLPRNILFDLVVLDAGTSYNALIMEVLVGGIVVAEFAGQQFDPATNNGCTVRELCEVGFCAGQAESVEVRFVNISGATLGAGATVRVKARVRFPGDPGFVSCWATMIGGCLGGSCPLPLPAPGGVPMNGGACG